MFASRLRYYLLFFPTNLAKKTSKLWFLPATKVQAHGAMPMGTLKSPKAQGHTTYAHGNIWKPLKGKIYSFFVLFYRFKCLGIWNEFSQTCIVFKFFVRKIDLHYSNPLIHLMVSWFFELHDLATKIFKTSMGLLDYG